MQPVEDQRETSRRGLARVARQPGNDQHRRGGEQSSERGDQLGDRTVFAARPVDPQRNECRQAEEPEAELHVDVTTAERRDAKERHERADREDRPERVDGGDNVEVDRDRQQPE